jgi:hypothetical protein
MVEQTSGSLIAITRHIRTGVAGGAMRAAVMSAVLLAGFAAWSPSHANNYGDDGGWQFQSTTDQGNMAAIQGMIQQKRAGGYGPASYTSTNTNNSATTNIGHQTNCSVTASAIGNSGSTSAAASSPSTSGASAASLANSNTNSSAPGYNGGTSAQTGTQSNSGTLGSTVNGSTNVTAQGGNYQVLNSTQTNKAMQTANITGSTACAYGALN